MPRPDSRDVEPTRRRGARGLPAASEAGGEESPAPLGWKDTLALILAAYQVLLPILLGMIAAFAGIFVLFRWVFF